MFVSLPVSAAGAVAEKSLVTASEKVSGNGEQLYKDHCEVCHGGSVAKAPALTLLNLMSASSVYRALDQGIMQQQAKVLTDSEKVAVAEYLTGQGLEQQALAPAPQCEGKAAQFNYDQPPISSGWGVDNSNQRHYGDSITSIKSSNMDKL
jgi:polyvinyl alcohol dehydrogenase (cytochrome)